jgi:putative endonuclease
MFYVYILKCNDNLPYTGFTENLKERFKRHRNGYVPATKPRLPVELIFYCAFINKYKALEFEKYLKSGSGRAFMQKHLLQ